MTKYTNKYNKYMWAVLPILSILVVVVTFFCLKYFDSRSLVKGTDSWTDTITEPSLNTVYTGSESVNNGMGVMANKVSMEARTSNLVFDVSAFSENLVNIEWFDNSVYVNCVNADYKFAVYVSTEDISVGSFSAEDVYKAKNDKDFVKTLDNTENTDGKAYGKFERLVGLNKEAWVYMSLTNNADATKTKTIDELTDTVKNSITFTSKTDISKKVVVRGIEKPLVTEDVVGYTKDDNGNTVKRTTAVAYDNTYNVVYICDGSSGETALFIYDEGNSYLCNSHDRLIQSPDYKNVYYDVGWKNDADLGYRSFAVYTGDKFVYFKIAEYFEDADEQLVNVLNALGISNDDEYIEPDHAPELTMEDMMAVNEDTAE